MAGAGAGPEAKGKARPGEVPYKGWYTPCDTGSTGSTLTVRLGRIEADGADRDSGAGERGGGRTCPVYLIINRDTKTARPAHRSRLLQAVVLHRGAQTEGTTKN